MKNGICHKCQSPAIYAVKNGFQHHVSAMPQSDSMFGGVMSFFFMDYVCAECGYYEQYISEKDILKKIVELAADGKRNWMQVPVLERK